MHADHITVAISCLDCPLCTEFAPLLRRIRTLHPELSMQAVHSDHMTVVVSCLIIFNFISFFFFITLEPRIE